jgi:hypothetical protein
MEVRINQAEKSSIEMGQPCTDRRHQLWARITASSGKENYGAIGGLHFLKIKGLRE